MKPIKRMVPLIYTDKRGFKDIKIAGVFLSARKNIKTTLNAPLAQLIIEFQDLEDPFKSDVVFEWGVNQTDLAENTLFLNELETLAGELNNPSKPITKLEVDVLYDNNDKQTVKIYITYKNSVGGAKLIFHKRFLNILSIDQRISNASNVTIQPSQSPLYNGERLYKYFTTCSEFAKKSGWLNVTDLKTIIEYLKTEIIFLENR